MNIYPVNISTQNDLTEICSKIQADPRALRYLLPKYKVLHVYAEGVDFRAASFLKQEMLSRGGDTIVAKHVIDAKTERSDVLIMGTSSQLYSLLDKLGAMDCWGLKEIRERLAQTLKGMNLREWVMSSPAGHEIRLSDQTKLMGIINITPDSFFTSINDDEGALLKLAEKHLTEGAYILDLGAESTRPGASPVSEADELERLIPALRVLRREFPQALISVDTYKPEVARVSAGEGADLINDISGFEFGGNMPEVLAGLRIPYVLSHIKGTPATMINHQPYHNILSELTQYFANKLALLEAHGVPRELVILDAGLGFGKSAQDNISLIKNIECFRPFGLPVMLGHSRKRFTGSDEIAGTLAVSAVLCGRVSVLRVHEVKENMKALELARMINESEETRDE